MPGLEAGSSLACPQELSAAQQVVSVRIQDVKEISWEEIGAEDALTALHTSRHGQREPQPLSLLP